MEKNSTIKRFGKEVGIHLLILLYYFFLIYITFKGVHRDGVLLLVIILPAVVGAGVMSLIVQAVMNGNDMGAVGKAVGMLLCLNIPGYALCCFTSRGEEMAESMGISLAVSIIPTAVYYWFWRGKCGEKERGEEPKQDKE